MAIKFGTADDAQRLYDAADQAQSNERLVFDEAIKTATFATPRITGALVKASHASKPLRERRDNLDLSIAHTADLLDRLTETRKRLGWHRIGDR